ncbi:MAG TPA: DUF4340 domain-containing protein [Bryobacterales bacterium]|nr:DUF4340 domain-containing protein [Bryobacterales bacterium]
MNELKTTILFGLTAAVLAAAVLVIDPGAATPEIFSDQGEVFYPNFTDPQAPKSIEVVDYDEETATARPLKVEFANAKWVIPSHYNYPADAENRLADTAAALMELRKDAIVSDRVEEHGEYGVIDPLAENEVSLEGRGKRVTLKDGNDGVLADFIIGKKVEGKTNRSYMRIPSQKRVYEVETSADVSAKFEDWIETDLLKLASGDIQKVLVNSYSINEMLGRLENQESLTLTKKDAKWTMSGGATPNEGKVNDLTGALDSLKIVDVQPKPENLTHDLQMEQGITLSQESIMSLQQKGFFITRVGQLLSNEGEIIVDAKNGIQYTLRFGEIASSGAGPQAAGQEAENKEGEDEQRYLFITVSYSEARAKQYSDGKDDGKGKELADELRNRFAGWYYVISGADFTKLRPRSRDLRG